MQTTTPRQRCEVSIALSHVATISSGQLFDLLGGALEDLHDGLEPVDIAYGGVRSAVRGLAHVAKRGVDLRHRFVEEVSDELAHPLEQVVDGGLILGEIGTSGVGDLVDFLSLVAGDDACEAEIFEQLQYRVDGTRARRIR